jgi:2',3'-cyclic-nucleotide 2'-phosphodiesterase (5'-nucleotidase family)
MTKNKNLTLIQVNDSHGYLNLHPELFWEGDHAVYRNAGGYARISSLFKQIRKNRNDQVLAFDCGDTFHGTYPVVSTRGQAIIPAVEKLGFDAMTAHWDFAYGPQRFLEITGQLSYPMLAINCYKKDSDELVFDPYIVKEAAGLRVGVVGIAATIIDKVMPKSFSEGVRFTLGNKELPGTIARLKNEEQVDLVVVISHLGYAQEVKLAREVDGIDVLLSGHTHNRVYQPTIVNDTVIIQSGCHGSFIGLLDLTIENKKVVDVGHQLIEVAESIEPDQEVQELIDATLKPMDDFLNEKVGETETDLNRNRVLESTMDNLLLDSLLHATGAELAFSNGWRYGAPVPAGDITVNDLWNIIPVNPPVSVVDLTGQEVRAMLEENLERTFARDPYHQMGGYVKRCKGLNLYFKIENPPNLRVCDLFVNGKRIEDDRVYRACFVTSQGVPVKYGSGREQTDLKAIDAMKSYINAEKKVSAELQGTVVAV